MKYWALLSQLANGLVYWGYIDEYEVLQGLEKSVAPVPFTYFQFGRDFQYVPLALDSLSILCLHVTVSWEIGTSEGLWFEKYFSVKNGFPGWVLCSYLNKG